MNGVPCGKILTRGGTGRDEWHFYKYREYSITNGFECDNSVLYWRCGEQDYIDIALCPRCAQALGINW